MKISKKGLYAIEALTFLAENYDKGVIPIHTIAEKEKIPKKFLEQILLILKNSDIVASEKGKEGGYRLKHHPKEIFLGKVIRLIDGPLAALGDARYLEEMLRKDYKHAGLYWFLLEVRNSTSRLMDQTSFYDLCKKTDEMKRANRKKLYNK